MLRSLDIRDVLIIDQLTLDFSHGLNVLTGETGAGKSILLDALGFVLGWRGRAELVRAGAAQGEVVAEFDLPADHAARRVLAEAGIDVDDGLILRRVNTVDGRKTAFVNDRRVSGEVLRLLSDTLVELHGQQDDRGLLNPRGHRNLLDAFAGVDLTAIRAAWRAQSQARDFLAAAQAGLARARVEEDRLRHEVNELDELAPLPGEDAQLDSRCRSMRAAAGVRTEVKRAANAISDTADTAMREAARWLEDASKSLEGQLEPALAALDRALIELSDAQAAVEDCLGQMEFNTSDLELLDERLKSIRHLARKHKVMPDLLPEKAEELRAELAFIDSGNAALPKLQQAVADAEAAYKMNAVALTVQRLEAARRLDIAMAGELAPLKMERAVFLTELSKGDPGPDGWDSVQFTVATNPGAPAGALNKIASGGELSRFLLALKVCLTGNTPGLTLIFDEIDRGVGGATADAVGRRLQSIAKGAQVLVVTHSPQVAALGGHHWRVEKHVQGDQTLSRVTALSAQDRIEEIARMLAGDRITEAARDAARSLLATTSP